MEMFARDQMKLHACAWPSWRCLLVIKCNSMLARDQARDFCSWVYATPWLLVIKLEMFACDQMQLRVCVARACLSDRCNWLDINWKTCACIYLPLFQSLCCQHTPPWVSRGWPLSNHPAGEDVTTVWHNHICIVQLLLCRGYAGAELTIQWRVATGLSLLDWCRISACRGSLL